MLINKRSIGLVAFLGICLTAAIWLLVMSGVVYAGVYWYFKPQFEIRTPISFDYAGFNASSTRISRVSSDDVGFPTIPLEAHDYAVSLAVQIPRSEFNLGLGNFMVSMALKPHLKAPIKQMALLPFKSSLIEWLDQIVFSPLYVFGFKSQLELLRIDLYDFIDEPSSTYQSFCIQLLNAPEIASAELIWSTRLRGFRKLMYHNPLSTCFLCVGFLWGTSLIVTITISLLVHLKLEAQSTAERAKKSPTPPPSRPRSRSSRGLPSSRALYTYPRRTSHLPNYRVRRRNSDRFNSSADTIWEEDDTMPTMYEDFDFSKS